MTDRYERRSLSREEFDRACARLEELYPGLSQTSGKRSAARNVAVGGNPASRHLDGLGRDYVHDDGEDLAQRKRSEILRSAFTLGLFGLWHDAGSGSHFHFQAEAPPTGT